MRTVIAALLVVLASACGARAQPPETCTAPIVLGDFPLDRVGAAVAKGLPLKIVVFGTTSSTLAGSDGARDAYPWRLEATLKRLIPGTPVEVVSLAKPRVTADKMVKTLTGFWPTKNRHWLFGKPARSTRCWVLILGNFSTA